MGWFDDRKVEVDLSSLESAGDEGLRVSGDMQSLGDGERSLLGRGCPSPLAARGPPPAPPPGIGAPSIDTPFSERNSSRSTY